MDHRYNKLLVLVEEGSYSKAAKRLRISQPAMTIAIASLEMGLGGQKLFIQKKPQVVLSESGKIVYQAAKKIKKDIDEMKASLSAASDNQHVNVGIIDSIAHLLYSTPKNNIILNDIEAMVDNSKKIINDVLDNQIEFGFITGQSSNLSSAISVKKLNNEEFVFVKKADLVSSNRVNNIEDWLCFNRASTSYHHFTKQFKEVGLSVKPIFYSTSMELLRDMALSGQGTALLPMHFIKQDLKDGRLKILNTPKLYRPIWAISKKTAPSQAQFKMANLINNLLAAK